MFYSLLSMVLIIMTVYCNEENNSCPTIKDYGTVLNNSNCWYNYMVDHNLSEIVEHYGYDFEEHKLTSADGYILALHRISNINHPNPKKSIMYLHHGYSGNSLNWIVLQNDSLGFMLAHEGYDVWMANVRGNRDSSEHVNLTQNDDKYWEYSLDEVATYDTPMILKHIAKVTGNVGNIIWVGHSLGTTVAITNAALNAEEAKKSIKLIILLGPALGQANAISPIRMLLPFYPPGRVLVEQLKLVKLISNGFIWSNVVETLYYLISPEILDLCFTVVMMFAGPNTGVMPSLIPMAFRAGIQGGSFTMIAQILEATISYPIKQWNYGAQENMRRYGSTFPPDYKLEAIQVPVHVIAAEGDWLTGVKDAKRLYNRLRGPARNGLHVVPSKSFNHIDFLGGSEAKVLINDYILKFIKDYD